MTNFKADCTINLHVESREKSGRVVWACSIVHYRLGRLILASRRADQLSKKEAEREAVLFGLRQTRRLLQEKVDVAASFPLKGLLPRQEEKASGHRSSARIESKGDDLIDAWESFRLRRIADMESGEMELLRKTAAQA